MLLGSGCCALVYQIGWLREFRLIFGASTAASAAVLAIFIGGLGIGGWVFGPRADRHPRPLLFYSTLELVVSLAAACTPFLLDAGRWLYLALGGVETLGASVGSGARMFVSALVLAVPTVAMGGTLPAVARAVTLEGDSSRRDVAALYALNTLGAVVGCVAATFVLLEALGTRQTLWLAAAVNVLIAMCARVLDRATPPLAETPAVETSTPVDAGASSAAAPMFFLLAASASVGFAFFLLELVWYRLLAPLLGGSVFTFGLVLAIALVGVGLGGLAYALAAANRPATLVAFATTCLLEGAAVAATYALGDGVALMALSMGSLRAAGFLAQTLGWTLVTAVVVMPPAIVAGYQFPLLIALFGRGRANVGRQIGAAYAANTAGAIAGSLAGGFGLLPWLSAPGAWQLVAALLLGLGAWALAMAMRAGDRRLFLPQLATAGLVIGCLMTAGPTAAWRHGGVGAGRVPPDVLSSRNKLMAWMIDSRRRVMWARDGVESGVALARDNNGISFIVNGKADGSARADAGTQVMLGLIGAVRQPKPTRSLVIGLGTGSSAGWLAAIPSMERVDVVELEPVVLDVARAARAVNRDVLAAPNVHVVLGDAREALLTSSARYDVIASEPSNPYRAGIASLFTQEYYRAAASRLTDDGVFVQWVQAYDIDARTMRTIYATLASVFPEIETWQTVGADIVLVARRRPFVESSAALAARVASEPYRSAIAVSWRASNLEGLLAHYIGGTPVARAIASGPNVEINTDDRNVVEFGLARALGKGDGGHVRVLRVLAAQLGAAHTVVSDPDTVAWDAVDTAWVGFNAAHNSLYDSLKGPASEEVRRAAIVAYYQRTDMDGARRLWPAGAAPRDLVELSMLADLQAGIATPEAEGLIEQLRVYQPAEADTLLAKMRIRQGRLDEATDLLERVAERLRRDPWPLQLYKDQALVLIEMVARTDAGRNARLLRAVDRPFAIHAMEDMRLQVAASLALRADDPQACRAPVAALDPHTPWNASYLSMRRDCYRRAGDSRVIEAERDLTQFLAAEPQPLVSLTQANQASAASR
jgi:spermidine synthase